MALGMTAANLDQYDVATSWLLRSAELARGDNDRLLAGILGNLGDLYMRQRRLDEALAVLRESLSVERLVGDEHEEVGHGARHDTRASRARVSVGVSLERYERP